MIGIVIVAHSARLAEGVRELAAQMVQAEVGLAATGGIDDSAHPFGTDAVQIAQAIESVYSDDGVVVLMDMGSALLSAEMALEFLSREQREKVRLCAAPLVEGALAASVQAAAGGDLEQVVDIANRALEGKEAQLQAELPAALLSGPPEAALAAAEERLIMSNRMGLHARPAARLVLEASRFQAEITVRNATRGSGAVSAKSINRVTTLDVRQGHEIAIAAAGADAGAALAALKALVENNFGETGTVPGEPEHQSPDAVDAVDGAWAGIPVSPGIAIGPAVVYRLPPPEISRRHGCDSRAEWQRLQAAVHQAREEIQALKSRTVARVGEYEAAIFDAHLLFLEDPALIEEARQQIVAQRINAEAVWQAVVEEMVAVYGRLEDPYLRGRAADLEDVGDRVLRVLAGDTSSAPELTRPGILVVADPTPSALVQLDPDKVLGMCAALGSANSHSAILARSLDIPTVVGLGPALLQVADGTLLALDGQQGRVWVNPDRVAALQEQREAWLVSRREARAAARQPAVTEDGQRVEIVANIRGTVDVRSALEHGAEGVGLLRTEFLYLERESAPSEEEQVAVYRAIAARLGKRPLTIRTLDVGGDKRLPYLEMQQETNPFLGQRGIRFCLDRPELFKTQVRAILRSGCGHRIKVMFPMVSCVEEVQKAREMLKEARDELRRERIACDESMETGIMVEVPAAVAVADRLAAMVDFFSIGTNDLSQYAMAADRTNSRVATLADALSPAVLRLIRQTVQAGHRAGIRVGLCGELAGDPLAAPILLGLKLDELSLNPPAIPAVKQAVARLNMEAAAKIAAEVLELDSAAAVRQYVAERLPVVEKEKRI